MAERTTRNVLFVRWNEDETAIQGIHIEERWAYTDANGVEQASKMLPARQIAPDDATALAGIAASINAAALADNAAKAAQIAQMTAEHEAALTAAMEAKTAAEAARDQALAQVAELQAQLAAYQTPQVDGVPQFIKKWQLWAGLRMDDPSLATYNAVKAYTDSFTGMARDLWLDSTGIERTAPALAGFKAGFHKTDADLDAMFTRYAAITLAQASALG